MVNMLVVLFILKTRKKVQVLIRNITYNLFNQYILIGNRRKYRYVKLSRKLLTNLNITRYNAKIFWIWLKTDIFL